MADYTKDFTAIGDAAPYTLPSPLVAVVDDWRIASGAIRGNGAFGSFYHDADYGNLIRSEVKIPANVSIGGDPIWALAVVRTGANAGKSIGLKCQFSEMEFQLISADGATKTRITYLGFSGITLADGDVLGFEYDKTAHTLKAYQNGTRIYSGDTTTDTTYASETSLAAGGASEYDDLRRHGISIFYGTGLAASSAPTISAPTPSGTIGTATTADIGCTTTNGASGSNTLYVVRSLSNVFSGVTGTQVKAGQRADGATTGVTATNAAVTTTTPSAAQSSLSGGTLYYYAEVQEDAGGLSNVLTGSFTTAVATRSVTLNIDASAGVPYTAASKFWTRTALDAAATDGGSGGLSGTPDGTGAITLSSLAIAAGSGWVTIKETANSTNSHNYPVTFA